MRPTIEQLKRYLSKTRGREDRLDAVCALMDQDGILHFGIESVNLSEDYLCGVWLDYVNLGDSYDATICHRSGRYFVSSWADEVERYERKNWREPT